jgi:hypothetical protein
VKAILGLNDRSLQVGHSGSEQLRDDSTNPGSGLQF